MRDMPMGPMRDILIIIRSSCLVLLLRRDVASLIVDPSIGSDSYTVCYPIMTDNIPFSPPDSASRVQLCKRILYLCTFNVMVSIFLFLKTPIELSVVSLTIPRVVLLS